jgi:hypothetical protein
MIQSFNKYQSYFNSNIVYILKLVLQQPQFNNYEDICELFDIHMRKFVFRNSKYSNNIKNDCLIMVKFFLKDDYINHIISSFEVEDDAYHYLAILVQFERMSNGYELKSQSPYYYFNPVNIQKMITELKF